jgi:small subunit ribosomal protein S6
LRDYELVTIVSPEVTEENIGGVNERLGQWIASGGGEVTNVNVWGRRRMAYPIRDFREGTYVATQFRMDPPATKELERSLKLSEDILRYLLVRMGD